VYTWDVEKLSLRYYLVKDILDKFFETNQLPALNKKDDPFWDPPEKYVYRCAF
jgi:kinesin family member 13